jgi:hypothetical protein
MKNLIKYFKSGYRLVPWYLIVFYPLLIGSDIFTTYLASPDLKLEANLIIMYFHLNYTHMIILSYTYACFGIISLFISRGYIDHFLREHQQNSSSVIYQVFHNKKMFFSYLLLGGFYFHFFCSVYCTINNYLSYIYIFDHDNPLINISRSYIESMHIGVKNYYIYSQVLICIIGYTFTVFKIKRIASEAYVPLFQELQKSN